MLKLTQQKIAVSTHEYFKGSGQELRDFLNKHKISRLWYIAHLFFYSKQPSVSYLNYYENGELKKESKSPVLARNEFFLYLRDAFYNLKWLLFEKEKIDLYVGVDSFNALFGILLKKLGRVKRTSFLTIDYVMHNRFKQAWLNKLYIAMDRWAFFGSDFTLNVSDRMSRQRILELGDSAKEKKQIVVPIGIMTEAYDLQVVRKDNVLVYSGGLTPEFGLELLIEAMPKLVEKFPDLEFRIIGDGVLKEKLVSMAKDLQVEKNINFVGYIDTAKERTRWLTMLKESTLGLATYEDNDTTYKRFSDVTKPKDYMSCGLPIITTSVIPLSEDVQKHNLGRVVGYNVDSIVAGISDLLRNENERKQIEQNVYAFSKDMTWDNIFIRMFREMDIEI
ncbi:glycosyltransferase family 4 protein [Patescibacteria group bacterium]|nr:glycosyltransferase family 4 protein [Patescibacteria group bacterium]